MPRSFLCFNEALLTLSQVGGVVAPQLISDDRVQVPRDGEAAEPQGPA